MNVIAAIIDVPTIDKQLCSNAWKNPDKGLPVFQKYLDYIKENPTSVKIRNVIEDLEDVLRNRRGQKLQFSNGDFV
jgi:hypothetical protein